MLGQFVFCLLVHVLSFLVFPMLFLIVFLYFQGGKSPMFGSLMRHMQGYGVVLHQDPVTREEGWGLFPTIQELQWLKVPLQDLLSVHSQQMLCWDLLKLKNILCPVFGSFWTTNEPELAF